MAAQMFAQSGTSCGCTRTGPGFDEGGGPTKTYPQFTIYDSMALDNVSFGLYQLRHISMATEILD
jgi:hypothetical protein